MSTRVWTWLLSLSVLWGGSFFFAKVALGELAPLTVVFGRVALAALALNVVLGLMGRSFFRAGVPWPSSILNATTPLFTLLVAHVATQDERIGVSKAVALLLGLGGVAILTGPPALAGSNGMVGQLARLAAAGQVTASAGSPSLHGDGIHRCCAGCDRWPVPAPLAPREIAARLHNCASGGSLLGCPRAGEQHPQGARALPESS